MRGFGRIIVVAVAFCGTAGSPPALAQRCADYNAA